MNCFKAFFSAATGILDSVVMMSVSTVRYLVKGPLAAEWDWRTQVSRDMLVYWYRQPEDSKKVKAAVAAILQALESLPWAIGYARTEYLVPNVGIEPRHLANSGIWAEKLDAASKGPFSRPGPTLRLDKIVSTRNTTTTGVCRKAVLYMHGGAFVTGGRFDNLPVALSLSSSTKMPVYLLDYRLAPATKYPGQLYDAYCAFRFLVDNLGYSIGDIVFAGDSAGGNLALALWQLTREPVAGLVLLSPRVDVVSARRSWKTNIEWDILPEYNVEDPGSSLAQLLEQGDRQRLEDPFLAPIHASLDALPPTLIQAGTREVMLDDIREFVRRVRLQGNTDVVYTEYAGGFHVFQSFSLGAANSVRAWKQVQQFALSLS